MTTDWVAAQFRRIGLDTRVQEFDLPPRWFPASWEVAAIHLRNPPVASL
jgi:hypothetical protein